MTLKTLTLKALGLAVIATAGITGSANAGVAAVEWADGNGNYYELFVSNRISWSDANAAATASEFMGVTGHLVTITSQAEQDFLNDNVNLGGVRSWLGLTDVAEEGTFEWITGELFDFTNWAAGEPNNDNPNDEEDFGLGWWNNTDGWNDCPNGGCKAGGYIVEYETGVSAVPLPATLPMLALGLGAVGFVRNRRKAA